MGLRILGMATGALAFLATFAGGAACGVFVLWKLNLLGGPLAALVLGSSLVLSVLAFRPAHDWVVLRWSNEREPFVYGPWKIGRYDLYG